MSLIAQYKSGAKRRGLDFLATPEQMKELFGSNCHYCNRPPRQVKKGRHDYGNFVYNGVDRVDSTKGYIEGNIVPCCNACNVAKWKMTHSEFIEHCKRIASIPQ